MTPSFGLEPCWTRLPRAWCGPGRRYVVTKIIASGAAGQPDGKCGSVTEPEEHDVAVLNDVFLAFGPGESLFPGWFPSPHSNEVIVGHRLRSNEPLLEIGVDHAGRSGGFVAPVNGPGTHFLLSGGEVALESEQVIGRVSQTIQARFPEPQRGEELGAVLRCELRQFGFHL